MQEIHRKLKSLLARVEKAIELLNICADEIQIEELSVEVSDPDFWNDSQAASTKSQHLATLTKHVDSWRTLERELRDATELAAIDDHHADSQLKLELDATLERSTRAFEDKEFELKLSGKHDRSSAIIEIHAGTGGTDAQDWSQMLERMYLRYAEKAGFQSEILSVSEGEEAGLKSVTLEVNGPFAYGKLRSEQGVHRLVRLSPFNADNLRQTSFALVEILPQLESSNELEINPDDLRIDVYRSGGKGGQSVNTTDSAVRITHIPTGLVVAIQNERSQLQNREKALAVLKARLTTLLEAEHKAELSELRGSDRSAAWGSQIRSYVLHPYTKVKDHRTDAETSQAQAVLDGDIDIFIDAFLRAGIKQQN
jgi:peptide chain release factor 2